jgi:hypothetical protein
LSKPLKNVKQFSRAAAALEKEEEEEEDEDDFTPAENSNQQESI